LFCNIKQVNPNTLGLISVGVVLALVVAIVPLTSLQFIASDNVNVPVKKDVRWMDSFGNAEKARPKNEHANPKASAVFESIAKSASKTLQDTAKTSAKSPAKKPSLPSNLEGKLEELRQSIRRLPGAIPFTVPEVIKQLQLSDSQQKRIRELIDSAMDAIKNIGGLSSDGRVKENEPAVRIIMDAARDNVVELLDPEQKKKWNDLSGGQNKQ
jgi:hypothetical protein